ncbi:MAG TPA: hypothetical protein VLD67_21905 [Vicinamibacterales bacterium]|nr:hypothetical protein [Vicinamibacterales bacterium]
MKILVSWSGGKDSAWMLHILRSEHAGTPAALLTSVNDAADRIALHGVRAEILEAQAAAAGLPSMTVRLPSPCPNEVYEQRMAGAVRDAVSRGFTHVAFGDLFLEDVRSYREERLAGTGLTPIFPLWGRPTDVLSRQMIAGGITARITCLDPRVLPRRLGGRLYDASLLAELPQGVDPCGERGEFHTCVLAGPMFSKRIDVEVGETVEREGFLFTDLVPFEPAHPARTPRERAAG